MANHLFFYEKHFEYIIIFSWNIEVKFCGTLAYTLKHWEVEIILELYCLPYMNNDLMGSIDRGCWLYMNIAFNFHEILQKGGKFIFLSACYLTSGLAHINSSLLMWMYKSRLVLVFFFLQCMDAWTEIGCQLGTCMSYAIVYQWVTICDSKGHNTCATISNSE